MRFEFVLEIAEDLCVLLIKSVHMVEGDEFGRGKKGGGLKQWGDHHVAPAVSLLVGKREKTGYGAQTTSCYNTPPPLPSGCLCVYVCVDQCV